MKKNYNKVKIIENRPTRKAIKELEIRCLEKDCRQTKCEDCSLVAYSKKKFGIDLLTI